MENGGSVELLTVNHLLAFFKGNKWDVTFPNAATYVFATQRQSHHSPPPPPPLAKHDSTQVYSCSYLMQNQLDLVCGISANSQASSRFLRSD